MKNAELIREVEQVTGATVDAACFIYPLGRLQVDVGEAAVDAAMDALPGVGGWIGTVVAPGLLRKVRHEPHKDPRVAALTVLALTSDEMILVMMKMGWRTSRARRELARWPYHSISSIEQVTHLRMVRVCITPSGERPVEFDFQRVGRGRTGPAVMQLLEERARAHNAHLQVP